MSRMMPPGVHSEFQARMSLTVRAPEGSSPRAVLMRRLVKEMTERNETGHLREWMIDALLDRVARDSMQAEQAFYRGASQLPEGGAGELIVPAGQPVEGKGTTRAVQAIREEANPTVEDSQKMVIPPSGVPIPKGLRAM